MLRIFVFSGRFCFEQTMRPCQWKGLIGLEVKIRLNGLLAASAGFKEKSLELPEGTTILESMQLIALPVGSAWTRSSVNGRLRDKTHVLQDGDELLLFPVGGGG